MRYLQTMMVWSYHFISSILTRSHVSMKNENYNTYCKYEIYDHQQFVFQFTSNLVLVECDCIEKIDHFINRHFSSLETRTGVRLVRRPSDASLPFPSFPPKPLGLYPQNLPHYPESTIIKWI